MDAERAYIFSHAIVREAAYQLQLPASRSLLHAEALNILEGGRTPDQIPDFQCSELAEHARAAGEFLNESGLVEREKIYVGRAAAFAMRSWRHHEAMSAWLRLAALCAGTQHSEALRKAGVQALHAGMVHRGHEILNTAFASGSFGDCGLEVELHNALAACKRRLSRLEEAEKHYRIALDLVEKQGLREKQINVRGNLALLLVHSGRENEAEPLFQDAMRVMRERNEAHANVNLIVNYAIACAQTQRMEQFFELIAEAEHLARATENKAILVTTLSVKGSGLMDDHRLDEAQAAFEASLALAEELGYSNERSHIKTNYAAVLSLRGNLQQAMQVVNEALESALEADDRRMRGAALCVSACIHARAKDAQTAKEHWTAGISELRAVRALYDIEDLTKSMHKSCAAGGIEPLSDPQ